MRCYFSSVVIPYRLWHQLTQCLTVFVKTQHFQNGMLLEVYIHNSVYCEFTNISRQIALSKLSVRFWTQVSCFNMSAFVSVCTQVESSVTDGDYSHYITRDHQWVIAASCSIAVHDVNAQQILLKLLRSWKTSEKKWDTVQYYVDWGIGCWSVDEKQSRG